MTGNEMSSSSCALKMQQSNRRRKSLRKRVTGLTNRIVDAASSLAASSFLFVALWSTHSAFTLLDRDRTTSTTTRRQQQSFKVKRGNVFYANKWIPTRRFHLIHVAGLFFPYFILSFLLLALQSRYLFYSLSLITTSFLTDCT